MDLRQTRHTAPQIGLQSSWCGSHRETPSASNSSSRQIELHLRRYRNTAEIFPGSKKLPTDRTHDAPALRILLTFYRHPSAQACRRNKSNRRGNFRMQITEGDE